VEPKLTELPYKGDTVIGNDVWIGTNVTVLPGIKIGDGAIIAANATVTRDVEPYSIVGGNPIKLIKMRFSKAKIQELLELKWWDWDLDRITENLEYLTKRVEE